MKPVNNPDVGLGQEWIGQLEAWIDAHGLLGFDPFDVKQHGWIRSAQTRPFFRKATTVLTDRFPFASRRLLGVQPTENPKAHALVAMGKLRLFELTGDEARLESARQHLEWLRANSAQGYGGRCWGYPFDVHATGMDTPAGTPVLVICAIAGDAFCRAHALTGEEVWREEAVSIAQFIVADLPRMEMEDGTACLGYTPEDRRKVHNANLLGAEHLYRVSALTGSATWSDFAKPLVDFTVSRQQEDGAWPYGHWTEGDPFEKPLLDMIDHHHTGFVLRSLAGIYEITGDAALLKVMKSGFAYYRKHLFGSWGMPVNGHGRYPVDIHACAEGVLCPTKLAPHVIAAKGMAALTMRWSHFFLRDPDTGAPWYRKYPFFTSKIVYPRWGAAWMFYALAEYLHREYPVVVKERENSD